MHIPRLHHHPNTKSIVRNLRLKISEPLLFKPVDELDARTVLTDLLFLYDIFLLKKNVVTSAELLRADISIVMYIRLSVHLPVLLHGTTCYPLGNFQEIVKIEICFDLT